MQFLLSPFRLHSQHQHLVYLDAAPPHSNCRVLGSKPGVQKKTNNKPSNQHQTSFLLFKAGLSTKNHAEEAVFSSKHNQISVQLLTNQGTTSCLSTETAWSRSLACYKTELCSWLMPKEQQLEQLFH